MIFFPLIKQFYLWKEEMDLSHKCSFGKHIHYVNLLQLWKFINKGKTEYLFRNERISEVLVRVFFLIVRILDPSNLRELSFVFTFLDWFQI